MRLWTQAVRSLFRSPGFVTVAALALGLGIGSTVTIFSIVRAVFLRGLPYNDADSLVQLTSSLPERQITGAGFSYPRYEAVHERQTVFSAMSYAVFTAFTLTSGGGDPEQVPGMQIGWDYFPLLGITPAIGRGFTADEDRPGGANVALLSDGLWQRRFGGRMDAIGQSIDLDGRPHTIIGVLPRTATQFPLNQMGLWTPRPQEVAFLVRRQIDGGGFFFNAVARLKPGTSLAQAKAQVSDIAKAYAQSHPANADVKSTADVNPVLDNLVGNQRDTYAILFAAVACLLLIAGANVANLALARYAGRRKQIAIRYALGAGRRHVMSEMVAENIVLALVGGTIGVVLASVSLGVIKAWAGDQIPRVEETSIDPLVLLFAFGVSIVTGLFLGLLPAWQVAKPDLTDALKDSSRESTGGRRTNRTRSALLVAEVAVSFVLLVAAGLLVASFMRIQNVDPRFKPGGILLAGLAPPQVRYPERSEELVQFYKRFLERTRSLPGVASAAVADTPPLTGAGLSPFAVVGQPIPEFSKQKTASRHIISPGFFDAIGVKVTHGRDFNETDTRESQAAIIINENMAKDAFGDKDPIGQHLVTGMLQMQAEVVGVVSDTRSADLTAAPAAEMYYPVFQRPESFSRILVKTKAGDPLSILPSLRAALKEVDSNLPLTNPATYESLVAQNTAVRRMIMTLLLWFAGVALLLSMFGVYSVMSYAVGQRRGEIGVRMAMGALPEQVSAMVVRQGLALTGIGLGVGIVGALLVTRMMQTLLFETPPADPVIYVSIALLLTAVAALACWIPARRAAGVDPLIALRN